MTMLDPDKFQTMLNERDALDDDLLGLTRYQAQKCATIIMAGHAGHISYAEASTTVAHYLRAIAFDEPEEGSQLPSNSSKLWQVLEDLPWPRSGRPAEQPN